jgi:predicted alpha/beta-fold hydrolase
MKPFEPYRLLRNPHAQTIAGALWRRRFPNLPRSQAREFETEPGTRIRGDCHWQSEPRRCPTLLLVHGLEGSSESGYMRGLAERAFMAGFNAIRLNQRNCGGTEALTPTLYNSSLSIDYCRVLHELIEQDNLPEIYFAGYSMGGNLVMKMAAELGTAAPTQFRAIAAVCPSADLAACADAVALPQNVLYQKRFVDGLKARMRTKSALFPGKFNLAPLERVRTLREFDDVITSVYCGFNGATDYYQRSSALPLAGRIAVPALLITAKDDPFVPFASFASPQLRENCNITLLTPEHGGHCAFVSKNPGADRFWAEAAVMEFFATLRGSASTSR